MPEFILDYGSPEGARTFAKLGTFAQAYIEAMFFTETNPGREDDSDLDDATVDELAPETLARIKADCGDFGMIADSIMAPLYDAGTYGLEQAGRDFWFSRNGHGAGFFDRDLGERGDKLQQIASNFGELTLYRGDDRLLYLE